MKVKKVLFSIVPLLACAAILGALAGAGRLNPHGDDQNSAYRNNRCGAYANISLQTTATLGLNAE